ncbi:MAG: L-threonine 3-dehydrogenase [Candidatus Izemoplasmatales bacterium]|nr:L-threonine 3-dehydrogenase [Candidatus Izemoplasmatales bacterium]
MTDFTNLKEIEMQAVVKDKPEKGFSIVRKKISTELKLGEVFIKINSVSFCGTDSHIYNYDNWAKNRLKLPLTVGHEFTGEVIKIADDVDRVKVGDIVSAETHIICNECEFCLRGEGHICKNTKIIGVDVDGCFAEYIKIPAQNCFKSDKKNNPLHLSVQEPLGNAVHTVCHFEVKDKSVVICGAGPIGLMGVDVALACKAKTVIAIEVNEYRRNLAKELGATYVINPLTENTLERVMEYTNDAGADVVCEFSGNKTAIETAFKYIKAGGGMAMLGLPSENVCLNVSDDIVFKGIHIYGVVGRRIYDTWYKVKELIDNNMLHLDKIITHQFPLSKINEAAEVMNNKNCGKIILFP